MDRKTIDKYQGRLTSITKKWWFYLILLVIAGLPPFAANGYPLSKWPLVNQQIITHPIKPAFAQFYWVFKVVPAVLILLIPILGNRIRKTFSIYVGFNYALFAVLQSVSISAEYGLAICTSNLLLFLLIAILWLWEAAAQQNDFSPPRQPWWKYWVVLPALLAFWEPLDPLTLQPDFDPGYLLTSGAGLAFCMMTPVYLAILTVYFPKANLPLLRVSSAVGFFIGLGNMGMAFILAPENWWPGILHLPLLTIAGFGLVLSLTTALQRNSGKSKIPE